MTPLKILIIGANGQIGTELAEALAQRHGPAAVVTSDLAPQGRLPHLRHEALDVTDAAALAASVKRHGITQIYLLAAAMKQANSTWDETTRKQLFSKIQQSVLNDPPWLPLLFDDAVDAVRDNVHGWAVTPLDTWALQDAWVSAKS